MYSLQSYRAVNALQYSALRALTQYSSVHVIQKHIIVRTLHQYSALQCSHVLQSCLTVMSCSHVLQSCLTVMSYSHVLQSCLACLKCDNQKGYICGWVYPEYSVAWLILVVGFDS